MMSSPWGPTGSSCFRPPYRLPMPAAITIKTGFFMLSLPSSAGPHSAATR